MDFSRENILNRAKLTLQIEGDAIHNLSSNLGEDFVDVISTILESKGRMVLTGVEKVLMLPAK